MHRSSFFSISRRYNGVPLRSFAFRLKPSTQRLLCTIFAASMWNFLAIVLQLSYCFAMYLLMFVVITIESPVGWVYPWVNTTHSKRTTHIFRHSRSFQLVSGKSLRREVRSIGLEYSHLLFRSSWLPCVESQVLLRYHVFFWNRKISCNVPCTVCKTQCLDVPYPDPEICRCLQSLDEYTSWVRNPHRTLSDTPYISREVHQLDRYLDHTLHNCDEDIWILFSGRTHIHDPEDMTCDRMRDKDHSTKAYHRPNIWDRNSRVSIFSSFSFEQLVL